LSVFPIDVPSLRERRQDIIPLATHFLKLTCQDFDRKPLTLTRVQAEALQAYDWPGNVRELHNVIERSVILSKGDRLRLDPALASGRSTDVDDSVPGERGASEREFLTEGEFRRREHENIVAALAHADWKVSGSGGAAELLGIKPTTLNYRMKVLGIRKPA
jgi:DNA-binding NtrC family response regulator